MCGDKLITFLLNRKGFVVLSVTLLMVTMPLFSCGTTETEFSRSTIEHHDGDMNLYRHTLALRFAPRLYLHADEPFEIIGIVPVFHPAEPIIAYHIFFEDDAPFPGTGKEADHEILWVEYDPITLKVSDVKTLWHRTVLRTDTCLVSARASQQRPSVCIEWGYHGILPLGWDKLKTFLRPRGELLGHYKFVSGKIHHNFIMRFIRWMLGLQNVDSEVIFKGTYEEYLQFTKEADSAYYIKKEKIIVAEFSFEELKDRIKKTFGTKKEWPWW